MSAACAPEATAGSAAGPVWALDIGHALPAPGAACPGGWRLLRGALRLDPLPPASLGATPVQLALPGDLLGLEGLCGQSPMFRATALLPCRLQPLAVPDDAAASAQRLAEALGQHWMRSTELAALRCGAVPERLARLMTALTAAIDDGDSEAQTGSAPTIPRLPRPRPRGRDLAALLDTTPETVSRILAQWRREAQAAGADAGLPLRRAGVYHALPMLSARPTALRPLHRP